MAWQPCFSNTHSSLMWLASCLDSQCNISKVCFCDVIFHTYFRLLSTACILFHSCRWVRLGHTYCVIPPCRVGDQGGQPRTDRRELAP